jgi:porphobilinogen deaminase
MSQNDFVSRKVDEAISEILHKTAMKARISPRLLHQYGLTKKAFYDGLERAIEDGRIDIAVHEGFGSVSLRPAGGVQ